MTQDSEANEITPDPTGKSWQEVFAALDDAGFWLEPDEDRIQGLPEVREEL